MPGSAVVIPAGRTVVLDQDVVAASVEVRGVLVFADTADLALTAGSIMVHGDGARLVIGTAAAPYRHDATITLTGPRNDSDVMGAGSKMLMAMAGGEISMHGVSAAKTGWVKLAATAGVGDTTLQLSETTGWAPGDRIAVSPGGFDPNEVDEVTVSAVTGTTVTVEPALAYEHGGDFDVVEGQQVDTRAEVGLLSRNIVVQGDESSDASKFGGHAMVMAGGKARIEGVQFQRMGQWNRLGRYPIHWHRTGESLGDYIRDSSLSHNYQRQVVLHEASHVLVDGNVTYDTFSHSFVGAESTLETGTENVLTNNLAMLTRLMPTEGLAPDAFVKGNFIEEPHDFQDERQASGFWFMQQGQVVEGNVAAGSEGGTGFFYSNGQAVDRMFADNTAHANFQGNGANPLYPPQVAGIGFFARSFGEGGENYARGLIAHHNSIAGTWLEGHDHGVVDAALIANGRGTVNFHNTGIRDSVISGVSVNPGGQTVWTADRGGVLASKDRMAFVNQAAQGGAPRTARYHNLTVADVGAVVYLMWGPGGYEDPSRMLRFSEISLIRSPVTATAELFDNQNPSAVIDLDGTLSGQPGARIIAGQTSPIASAGTCSGAVSGVVTCPVPDGTDLSGLAYPNTPSG